MIFNRTRIVAITIGMAIFIAPQQLEAQGIGIPVPLLVNGPTREDVERDLNRQFLIFRVLVQHELKLSDKQKEQVAGHYDRILASTSDLYENYPVRDEEHTKALRALESKNNAEMRAFYGIFTADQRHRLRQLELQEVGVRAALDRPELASLLKLTDKQRHDFKAEIAKERGNDEYLRQEIQAEDTPKRRMTDSLFRELIRKAREGTEVRLESLLTDAQREQWNKLIGPRFAVHDSTSPRRKR